MSHWKIWNRIVSPTKMCLAFSRITLVAPFRIELAGGVARVELGDLLGCYCNNPGKKYSWLDP